MENPNEPTIEGIMRLDSDSPLGQMFKAALSGRRQQEPLSYEDAKERLAYLRDPANGVQGQGEAEQELLDVIYKNEFEQHVDAGTADGTLRTVHRTRKLYLGQPGEKLTVLVPHGARVLTYTAGADRTGEYIAMHSADIVGVGTRQLAPFWVYRDSELIPSGELVAKKAHVTTLLSLVDGQPLHLYGADAEHV